MTVIYSKPPCPGCGRGVGSDTGFNCMGCGMSAADGDKVRAMKAKQAEMQLSADKLRRERNADFAAHMNTLAQRPKPQPEVRVPMARKGRGTRTP